MYWHVHLRSGITREWNELLPWFHPYTAPMIICFNMIPISQKIFSAPSYPFSQINSHISACTLVLLETMNLVVHDLRTFPSPSSCRLSQVAVDASKKPLPPHVRNLVLEIIATDSTGEDAEVPYIKYKFRWVPPSLLPASFTRTLWDCWCK
jgi:hypothetical protein